MSKLKRGTEYAGHEVKQGSREHKERDRICRA